MKRRLLMLCCLFLALAIAPGCAYVRTPPPEPGWPATVSGPGRDIQEAKRNAVANIVRELRVKMSEFHPPLVTWEPTPDFVKRYVIQSSGKAGDDVSDEVAGTLKTWVYPIRAIDLLALDADAQRHQRRFERLEASLPWLGAYLLVLTGMAAYFRAVSFWRRLR